MYLTELATGLQRVAVIQRLTAADWKVIQKNKQFLFKWKDYRKKEVFRLILREGEETLGLMCIVDHTDSQTDAVEIELLESRADQVGAAKTLDRIAGCLIAWACRESVNRGHEGFIFLTPKSQLINHYHQKYGLEHWAGAQGKPTGIMMGDNRLAARLVREYLD